MTGFGRCVVENPAFVQQWEIRSVNNRHLDIKWRLPANARYLEPTLEKVVRRQVSRGRVEVSLQLQFSPGFGPRPVFDRQQAQDMLDALHDLAASRGEDFAGGYAQLLNVPELWTRQDIEQESDITSRLEQGLNLAIEDWNESRECEGEALGLDLQGRIERMGEWTALISGSAPGIREERIAVLRERLEEFLADSGTELEDARFLQEIVILTDRLDVSEELTRLGAHLERMRQLLKDGTDAGKRLDFTLQECFREINTCGNKLVDAHLSRIIVDFKNELEKCREQVQNLE